MCNKYSLKDLSIIIQCLTYSLIGKSFCYTLPFLGLNTENNKKLLALKDKYKNRRIFIIGNGPSLKKTDIRFLKNEITIGCNGIFLLFDYIGYLPTFYTVEDTLVAEDRFKIINSIKGSIKIFPFDLKYCLKPDRDTIFVNFLRRYSGFPQFSSQFEKYVYWGGTVTYFNMQLAYYLGAREIYLIGLDHNYAPPTKADLQVRTVITSGSEDANHFHPSYFGPGFRYHDPMPERMEMAYRKAKDFFNKHAVSVYNATAGGKLEVFERISYEKVIGKTA